MKRWIFIVIILFISSTSHDASAFWENSDSKTTSGLNVETGFDVNTVTTVNGVVIAPPERKRTQEPAVLSIMTAQGAVHVVIGPWWYWEQKNITISNNQDISVTGSRAQGKDGSFYIFAQRIDNQSNGTTITLRSETGVPFWSQGNRDAGRRQGGNPPARSGGRGNGMRGGRR